MEQEKEKTLVEKKLEQKWESLGIANDFIFGKVMQDEELLTELIQLILPDIKIGKIEIVAQKSIEAGLDIHGIRLDIYAKDENGLVYEIEMQITVSKHLPKRARYYSSMIDTQMLDKGISYKKLKNVYVIFICPEDPFGSGRHKYTFRNFCEEDKEIGLNDGSVKIFLNASGVKDDVSENLKAFLDYVAGITSDNPYVKKLDDAVKKAKMNKEWRMEYMMWSIKEMDIRDDAIEQRDTEIIMQMLRKGKTPEEIVDFCGFSMEQVLNVQEILEKELVATD